MFISIRNLLGKILPEKIKGTLLILLDYRVRSKYLSDIKISREQKKILYEKYSRETRNIIIFTVPSEDKVNGGILSICSICTESSKLKHIHNSEVIMCSMPDNSIFHPYYLRHRKNRILKFTKFKNQLQILDFKETLQYFKRLEQLTIHIPELYVRNFIEGLLKSNILLKNHASDVVINIMLQNIRFMPSYEIISNIKQLASKVTFTTAHAKYTSEDVRNYIGCPLHLLSVWASPEQYIYKHYLAKKELLVVSPDQHPLKQMVLDNIVKAHPFMEIRIVNNISYETFKEWMSDAKWTLTFGEGLDGYLGEGIFSGAIGFAVYNNEFFTEEFSYLETIYNSYDQLVQMISTDMHKYNNEYDYVKYQKKQYDLLCSLYDYNVYLKNITKYYEGIYDYP